jgi:uncharacterized protein
VIRVLVALALPGRQEVLELEMPEGSTAGDAIVAAKLVASAATVLREGDRVELYRALKADPKDARRARARLRPSTRSRSGP